MRGPQPRKPGLGEAVADLGRVVSRYIGETEKSLRRLFKSAESADRIEVKDEADDLFGRRDP